MRDSTHDNKQRHNYRIAHERRRRCRIPVFLSFGLRRLFPSQGDIYLLIAVNLANKQVHT